MPESFNILNMNLNKVFIIGNLTRNPETRALPSGKPVTTFGIATNRTWKNPKGERQQATEFHNIVMFGRLAEIAQQYLTKGSSVLIEGRLQTRSWEGQDGNKRTRTEIVAESMQLGPRRTGATITEEALAPAKNQNSAPAEQGEQLETIEYPEEDINPDDIPF